jgi:hypothetical protein
LKAFSFALNCNPLEKFLFQINVTGFTWIAKIRESVAEILKNLYSKVGRDGKGGLATVYGLGDLDIESRWGQVFPHRPWGPFSLLYNVYRVIPEGKAAGASL